MEMGSFVHVSGREFTWVTQGQKEKGLIHDGQWFLPLCPRTKGETSSFLPPSWRWTEAPLLWLWPTWGGLLAKGRGSRCWFCPFVPSSPWRVREWWNTINIFKGTSSETLSSAHLPPLRPVFDPHVWCFRKCRMLQFLGVFEKSWAFAEVVSEHRGCHQIQPVSQCLPARRFHLSIFCMFLYMKLWEEWGQRLMLWPGFLCQLVQLVRLSQTWLEL